MEGDETRRGEREFRAGGGRPEREPNRPRSGDGGRPPNRPPNQNQNQNKNQQAPRRPPEEYRPGQQRRPYQGNRESKASQGGRGGEPRAFPQGDGSEREGGREFPRAKLVRHRWYSLVWVVPVAAVALGGWFAYHSFTERGPRITITFQNGEGLESGNTMVKYRGVRIGKVDKIELSSGKKEVVVHAELEKTADDLPRAGSRFWIVRPEISVGSVKGLGTIVSGNYIAMAPGDGEKTDNFQGLETPPVEKKLEGGLEIVLLAGEKGALERGTPVMYRGIQVGLVRGLELATNARTVNATVHIEREYAPLVRLNSKFWNSGGLKFNFSLFGGGDLQPKSINTLFSGGISFATPNELEKSPPPGMIFRIYDKPQDDWLNWSPEIALPLLGATNRTMEGSHKERTGEKVLKAIQPKKGK